MAGQIKFRRYLATFFGIRDGKVRYIRIANDIEHNLASYVAVVTVINAALGTIVALGAWLIGLPSPLMLGIFAMLLNYIP
jgi:predicted PurR-regulated permease PerM